MNNDNINTTESPTFKSDSRVLLAADAAMAAVESALAETKESDYHYYRLLAKAALASATAALGDF